MRIAICDDDLNALQQHKNRLEDLVKKHSVSAVIDTYSTGDALLFAIDDREKQPDLLYLDINMPGLNGLETAAKLRAMNCRSEVIFCTVSQTQWRGAFKVNAMDYIIKTEIDDTSYEQTFLAALARVEESNKEILMLSCSGRTRNVNISSIRYFEVKNRIITVYYGTKEFEFYSTLERVAEKMEGKGFIRIHRSFLVAISRIAKIKYNAVILDDNTELPVGRRYVAKVKELVL